MNCATVDELAGAYALGAIDRDEELAIGEHLATCDQAHAEARELIGVAALVPGSLDPVPPSAGLRDRLMATIEQTPQEGRPAVAPEPAPSVVESAPRRPWWQLNPLPAGLAAVALAAVVGLGGWNLALTQQLADRDAALRAVAAADAAYAVSGSAGSGWVLESDGRAIFLADRLAALPADRIYELWLIDAGGAPVAVGVLDEVEEPTIVTLERALGGASAFAVTVESERVEAPTSEPVLVGTLGG